MAEGDNTGGTGGNGGGSGDRTFTQAEVNRLIAEERRRTEQRFGDYDQLKKDAEDGRKRADAQKSDIDKLTDAVTKLTERAVESESALARRDAATKHKLPDWVAKKLTAKSPEDADREAKEWHDNLKATGWNPDGGGGKGGDGAGAGDGNTGGNAGSNSTGGNAGSTGQLGGGGNSGDGASGARAGLGGNAGGRPRENLRPGTTGAGNTGGNAQEDDPRKIADDLMSRSF